MIPVGQEFVSLRTVDPGDAIELVAVALETEWQRWAFGLKVDGVDRNPTSSGREIDIDEFWLRFGDEAELATLADSSGFYFKIGKFPHFERQDDRHLESYGLANTAFNRMEDVGAEVVFPNQDPILHNVFSLTPDNDFDLGLYGRGEGRSVTFSTTGLVASLLQRPPRHGGTPPGRRQPVLYPRR